MIGKYFITHIEKGRKKTFIIMLEDLVRDQLGELTLMDDLSNAGFMSRCGRCPQHVSPGNLPTWRVASVASDKSKRRRVAARQIFKGGKINCALIGPQQLNRDAIKNILHIP